MGVAYFAGGPLVEDKNGKLYGISYNDKLLSRYLSFCDDLELCMRKKKQDEVTGLSEITLPNVHFTEVIDLTPIRNFPKSYLARKTINEVIDRCDGIIIRLPSTTGRIAIRCCRKKKKPFLVEMVGCPWDALWNHSWKGKILAAPITLMTKHETKIAPAVIYVTNEFLQRRYPTKGKQIGCSDVEFEDIDESILKKRKMKIQSHTGTIIIGTTAAVNVKYKGQHFIIRALGELKKRGITNYKYQLVGNGSQDYLKRIAKECDVEDQVELMGGMSHEDVFKWLDSIDLYVQPSKQEGLPRALVEAMSRGLPAFGSNTGGIPELLDPSCIFKKGHDCEQRIINVLESFDKDKMLSQSVKNYETAHHYRKEELEERRNKFYKGFFENPSD